MSDSVQKKQDILETTKHTEQSSIIEERLPHKINGEIVRRYIRGKLLGKGGFAKCYEVTNVDTKKIYAIKMVSKENLKKSKTKQKLITEIKIHKSLRHRRVVAFDHVFEDNNSVYIMLQLCSNNTLNDLLKRRKRLTENEAQYFISQLTEGLTYIHSCKVIHRDLKLGNLMLSENMELKIGDFGLAAKLESLGERKKTICGTPNYIAPQILEGKGHSYEVDIWSMGAILFALLYGRPPFETSDVKKTYKRIKECQYNFNDEIPVSDKAKNLISRLLVVDPTKRLTLEQIRSHPFLSDSKIPDTLPASIFSTALVKSSTETQLKSCGLERPESRAQSGISERLLLRTSSGLFRNYFAKTSGEKMCYNRISANNFFSTQHLPESNRKAREIILHENSETAFVKKWVDYSSKYGLGYLLSNRSSGIFFNDCSKIVLNSNNQNIDYISSSGQLSCLNVHSNCSDRQIAKKITLMQYFSKYLKGNNFKQDSKKTASFCYVKRWAKSEQGIIFRLSNKVLQINFVDKSQMIIYTQQNVGIYSGASLGNEKVFFEIGGPETKHNLLSKKMEDMVTLVKLMAKPLKEAKMVGNFGQKEVFAVEDL